MNDKYVVIKELGRGGFGSVYLAQRKFDGELVAIKYLHRLEDDILNRFRREIRILVAERGNPFIVDFIDWGIEGDQPYYVMEYCPDGSLRKLVGYANVTLAVQVFSCVVQGLASIHAKNGFHRDIKPDNILISKDVNGKLIFKLSDIGLARTEDTLSTFTANPMGTYAYLPPEVLKGEPYSDKADIYSLGITIIELLTGKRDVDKLVGQMFPLKTLNLTLKRCVDNDSNKRFDINRLVQLLRRHEQELKNLLSQPTNINQP